MFTSPCGRGHGEKHARNLYPEVLLPYLRQGALRSMPAPVPAPPGEASGCGFATVLDPPHSAITAPDLGLSALVLV